MRLVIRDAAAADLEHIYASIACHSPRAADTIVERLLARMRGLLTPGQAGPVDQGAQPARANWSRGLTSSSTRVDDEREIVILTVVHGRRESMRPQSFAEPFLSTALFEGLET